jgi:hypothetical protein
MDVNSSPTRLQAIRDLGVVVHHEQEYYGEVPRQHRDRPDTFASAFLGDVITAKEWVRATQREGADYIGPCCGNTGACQDILAGVYRDGGSIDRGDLWMLGSYLSGHDGYELFALDTDEAFEQMIDGWRTGVIVDEHGPQKFGVWEKFLTVYRAVEPMLFPGPIQMPWARKERPGDLYAEADLRLLEEALGHASWKALFHNHDDDEAGLASHRLQYVEQLARVRPMVARLHEALSERPVEFDGFAMVTPGTEEVLSNGMGLCLYATREQAERIREVTGRAKDDAEEREHGRPEEVVVPEVVPVVVTLEGGLEVRRAAV